MLKDVTWKQGMTLDELELKVIEAAFYNNHSVKIKTAESLGIAKRTLDKKLKELQIENENTGYSGEYQFLGDDVESQNEAREAREREKSAKAMVKAHKKAISSAKVDDAPDSKPKIKKNIKTKMTPKGLKENVVGKSLQ